LKEIDLTGNSFQKESAVALSQSLAMNSSLTFLSLRDCSLSGSSILPILTSLKVHGSILKLDLSKNKVIGLDEIAKEIGDLLERNKTLRQLDISHCELGHHRLILIANGLAKNSTLRRLVLDGNRLGKHFVNIGQAIGSNGSLEELSVKKASISKKHLETFLESIGSLTSLATLSLNGNAVGIESEIDRSYLICSPSLDIIY